MALMNEAKENPRCLVHFYRIPDGQCSCPHDCETCGVTYVGLHSKDDCVTVLKRRLRLNELSAKITALSAGRESMSNEELVAAARADLLANLPKPMRPGTYNDKFGDIRWVGTGEPVKPSAPANAPATVFCRFGKDKNKHRGFFGGYCVDCGHPETIEPPAPAIELCTACHKPFDSHPEPGLCCYPDATFSSRWSPPYVPVESAIEQKINETSASIEAAGLCKWKYACPYCLEGYVPVPSSVSEAMVHPDTTVGRVICEGRDKPTVLNISADMIGRGYKGEAVDPADAEPLFHDLYELSKNDHAIIVGSEIRCIIATARQLKAEVVELKKYLHIANQEIEALETENATPVETADGLPPLDVTEADIEAAKTLTIDPKLQPDNLTDFGAWWVKLYSWMGGAIRCRERQLMFYRRRYFETRKEFQQYRQEVEQKNLESFRQSVRMGQ